MFFFILSNFAWSRNSISVSSSSSCVQKTQLEIVSFVNYVTWCRNCNDCISLIRYHKVLNQKIVKNDFPSKDIYTIYIYSFESIIFRIIWNLRRTIFTLLPQNILMKYLFFWLSNMLICYHEKHLRKKYCNLKRTFSLKIRRIKLSTKFHSQLCLEDLNCFITGPLIKLQNVQKYCAKNYVEK